jgi:hypothetical protein
MHINIKKNLKNSLFLPLSPSGVVRGWGKRGGERKKRKKGEESFGYEDFFTVQFVLSVFYTTTSFHSF